MRLWTGKPGDGMDLATIIGIVLGSAVVGAAIYLGGDFLTFVNVPSVAGIIRKNGPLGLEGVPIEDEFLSKGVQYIADGYEGESISELLERERDLRLERLGEGKRFFKAMGDSAPAFGWRDYRQHDLPSDRGQAQLPNTGDRRRHADPGQQEP